MRSDTPAVARALEDRALVGRELGRVEVAVGVDQASGLTPCA